MHTKISSSRVSGFLLFGLLAGLTLLPNMAQAWWNDEWSFRKTLTIDTSASGAGITQPIGTTPVLVRLHVGNFNFGEAKEDGSDLRFVAADDKTPLKHHIEKYDPLLGEAFIWVAVPNLAHGAKTDLWLYYGNEEAAAGGDPKETYDADTVLAYHFTERNMPIRDYSAWGNNAQSSGTIGDGALIGSGLNLDGQTTIPLPASPSLSWGEGAALTWSAWVKTTTQQPNAVIFSRRDGITAFLVGIDNGVPFAEVTDTFGVHRTGTGAALPNESWHHLAVVADAGQIALYVDGNPYASLDTGLPAMSSAALLGGDSRPEPTAATVAEEGDSETGNTPQEAAASTTGDDASGAVPSDDAAPAAAPVSYVNFTGELDELHIAKTARSPGFVKAAAIGQGAQGASFLSYSVDEETASWFSGYFTVIVTSVTVDAWVVIAILAVMAVISWIVMADKAAYVNRQQKANSWFMRQFRELSSDLTMLDQHLAHLADGATGKDSEMVRNSSLYRIYHIGSEEIRHRFGHGGLRTLGAESIAAIRAALDTGLVRENQKLHRLMVILTIAISGGPFLGLLGTVIGVMITFAAVAAAGEVNVNAIAPGVAAALLATVAGLAVAIPALFGYNYLTSRISDITSDMQVFADEFVTKMAEFYRGHPDQSFRTE